jgi:hypothetical protein
LTRDIPRPQEDRLWAYKDSIFLKSVFVELEYRILVNSPPLVFTTSTVAGAYCTGSGRFLNMARRLITRTVGGSTAAKLSDESPKAESL